LAIEREFAQSCSWYGSLPCRKDGQRLHRDNGGCPHFYRQRFAAAAQVLAESFFVYISMI
jgi:hypothetical protein